MYGYSVVILSRWAPYDNDCHLTSMIFAVLLLKSPVHQRKVANTNRDDQQIIPFLCHIHYYISSSSLNQCF